MSANLLAAVRYFADTDLAEIDAPTLTARARTARRELRALVRDQENAAADATLVATLENATEALEYIEDADLGEWGDATEFATTACTDLLSLPAAIPLLATF